MTSMPIKPLCLLICLITWISSFGQPPVSINGKDSIKIRLISDTAQKKVIIAVSPYYSTTDSVRRDTFALKTITPVTFRDSAAFYNKVRGYASSDSIRTRITDSIRKHLAVDRNFLLVVIPIPPIIDTSNLAGGNQGETIDIAKLLNTQINAVIAIAVMTVMAAVIIWLFLLLKKERSKKSVSHELPESLMNIFPGVKKERDDDAYIEKIGREYQSKLNDLSHKTAEIERKDEELIEWEKKINARDCALQQALQELNEQKAVITQLEADQLNIKAWSEKLLNRYFTTLSKELAENKIKNKEQVYQLILRHLIPFSIHSASLLKKQLKDASELDTKNLQILDGETPVPTDIVTDNTQEGHVDPLAYFIYRLLQNHQIEGLDGVLVKGYKIGK